MRKLQSAAQSAGAHTTAEDVAKHYVAPVLAPYFAGADAKFLKQLTTEAQFRVDRMTDAPGPPSSTDIREVQSASERIRQSTFISGWIGVIAFSIVGGIYSMNSIEEARWLGFIFPFLGPGFLAYLPFASIGESIAKGGKNYQNVVSIAARTLAFERTKIDYWRNLDWRELELRIASLFSRMGYSANATPGSNDKGVDVVAESPSEKIIIQCKEYSKPAQRNIVSELLGAQVAESADRAILICTGGFTSGAESYARENGIELWDLEDIAREDEKLTDDRTDAGSKAFCRVSNVLCLPSPDP